MRLNFSLLPIFLVFPFIAFASATWPNEPAGSHSYLDCPFNMAKWKFSVFKVMN